MGMCIFVLWSVDGATGCAKVTYNQCGHTLRLKQVYEWCVKNHDMNTKKGKIYETKSRSSVCICLFCFWKPFETLSMDHFVWLPKDY